MATKLYLKNLNNVLFWCRRYEGVCLRILCFLEIQYFSHDSEGDQ